MGNPLKPRNISMTDFRFSGLEYDAKCGLASADADPVNRLEKRIDKFRVVRTVVKNGHSTQPSRARARAHCLPLRHRSWLQIHRPSTTRISLPRLAKPLHLLAPRPTNRKAFQIRKSHLRLTQPSRHKNRDTAPPWPSTLFIQHNGHHS